MLANNRITKRLPIAVWRYFGIMLAATLLAGCGQGESNVVSGNREGILHFSIGAEPQSLDPHVITSISDGKIARALFEPLVYLSPVTLEPEPGAARRWEISADGTRYTFYLRPEARWSNGERLTATDWVWSFYRSLHPQMGNQFAYLLFPIVGAEAFARGDDPDFENVGISAPDDFTLEISLQHPTPYFLQLLAGNPNYPVHRATIEAHGRFTDRYTGWTRPGNFVGNGPFTLTQWRLGRYVRVRRNPWYWDAGRVSLNGIDFHTVENALSEEKMFRVGQLHFTDGVPLSRVEWYRQQPDSPYRQAPLLGTYYYMFNTLRSPVDDVRVRRALALSVDRQAIIDKLLYGTAVPSPSLTPRDLIPGYDPPELLAYDPDQARQLLADAGYPGGAGWPGLELLYNTSEDHRKIAVAVQQMWKKELNIKVSLVNQEWKVFLDTTQARDYQLARMGWSPGEIDATGFLESFLSDNGVNRTGFSDARYDDILLRLAPAKVDPAARNALLQEAETILMREVPLIPFYTYTSRHLVQPSVRGVPSNMRDLQDFRYISLDPDVPVWKPGD